MAHLSTCTCTCTVHVASVPDSTVVRDGVTIIRLGWWITANISDPQLSAVEWDPENNDLKTVSLHLFEDEELRVRERKTRCI